MALPEIMQAVVDMLRQHEHWILPLVFVLAFIESLVMVSLLFPATTLLFGIGALIGQMRLSFWPLWAAAAVGAFLGDWLSYWLGYHYNQQIIHRWPFSKRPSLVPKGIAFFERWGLLGVFIGRFFGPLRASVPLAAGICRMPFFGFQLANISSSAVWAFGVLAPGAFGLPWLSHWLA